MKIAAIVTDIDGTTAGTGFHHDVLMPYSLKHIAAFVREHQEERDVMRALVRLSDRTHIPLHNLEGLIRALQQWIRDEEPVTELKTLQGMVWEKAYKQGMFQAHVYPDVPEVLQRWQQQERNLYVYSHESVKAQQLFYRYSTEGDMRLLFSGHYDSTLGPKDDPASYARIAEAIALPAARVMYIADDRAELDAAAQAGLKTTWVIRPQDTSLDPERVRLKSPHPVVTQFGEIVLD
jgi:enolase-phosphatase E1